MQSHPTRDQPAISVRHLTKRYRDVEAVQDLSFDVAWGRVTGFLGQNGAGKTTTLRAITGLVHPNSGTIAIAGHPYVALGEPARIVGTVLETAPFHPGRTARNHLRVIAAAAGLAQVRVDHVLDVVGLTEVAHRRTGGFSLGMQQRLALATALLGEPQILILDEPANGLDPGGIRWLRSFLRSFATAGHAVFVSSHQLSEVSLMADEVVLIDHGRLIAQSPVEDLMKTGARTIRIRSDDLERLTVVLEDAGIDITPGVTNELVARGTTAERIGSLASSGGVVLYGLAEEERSLEDIFFELTSKEGIR